MLVALVLGLGLLREVENPRALDVKATGTARRGFTIPHLSWPPPTPKVDSFLKRGTVESRPSPADRPSAPPVHCTLRTLKADPQVDPHMAQTWESEPDSRMVVKSRCAN